MSRITSSVVTLLSEACRGKGYVGLCHVKDDDSLG